MIRLIYFVPIWAVFFILRNLMFVLGWVVVPIAALFRAWHINYDKEKDNKGEYPNVYHFTWKWMYPWDNDEDGIACQTYWKAKSGIKFKRFTIVLPKFSHMFFQILHWSCVRNPANNLRYVPYISCKIEPKKVRWIGTDNKRPYEFDRKPPEKEWFVAWQGFYSCLWIQKKFFPDWVPLVSGFRRLWIGHKVFPEDTLGIPDTSYRKDGAGFAIQFKRLS